MELKLVGLSAAAVFVLIVQDNLGGLPLSITGVAAVLVPNEDVGIRPGFQEAFHQMGIAKL